MDDARLAAQKPDAKSPRRRLVYGLLRLDRPEEAETAAQALLVIDPSDPASRLYASSARRYREVRARPADASTRPGAVVDALPLPTGWVR